MKGSPTQRVGQSGAAVKGRKSKKYSRCDACGKAPPDVVGPILIGLEGWKTFEIDGVFRDRAWKADVLLCGVRPLRGRVGGCSARMEAFVAAGGRAGEGPQPPHMQTTEGGWANESEFIEELEAGQHAAEELAFLGRQKAGRTAA